MYVVYCFLSHLFFTKKELQSFVEFLVEFFAATLSSLFPSPNLVADQRRNRDELYKLNAEVENLRNLFVMSFLRYRREMIKKKIDNKNKIYYYVKTDVLSNKS